MTEGVSPYCACDDGYSALGLSCVHECEGVDCSGHGSCTIVGGAAACSCDEGYEPGDSPTSCVAAPERWLVGVTLGGEKRAYLTLRGCVEPRLLCTGCKPHGISPSGSRAAVGIRFSSTWEMHDGIGVVDLLAEEPSVRDLDIEGGGAFWEDDEHLFYTTTLTELACNRDEHEVSHAEHNQIRVLNVESGADLLVVDEVTRGDATPIVSRRFDRLAYAEEDPPDFCHVGNMVVRILDRTDGSIATPSWSTRDRHDVPLGLLPDESGFLVGVSTGPNGYDPPTTILVVTWSGDATPLYEGIDGYPGSCRAPSRVGPGRELYCTTQDGRLLRLTLDGDDPVEVECTIEGVPGTVRDVWQGS